MMWCDAIMIVYSVTDRSSFAEAQRLKITSKIKRRELRMTDVSLSALNKFNTSMGKNRNVDQKSKC